MAIGIISAMKEEITALLEELQLEKKVVKGMRTYFKGKLFNHDVVLVFSRWGKVAAATSATELINEFSVEEMIFTGVAGALHDHINIGDVIIGKELYQHDMDGSPIVETFEIPLLGKTGISSSDVKRPVLLKATQRFLDEKHNFISKEQFMGFGIIEPKTYTGDIASGDQFISSAEQSSKILSGLPSVLCVEMEGAAVAQVCYEYEVPYSIIRTISDNADHNAHIDFPKFAKEIASNYALGILKNYLS